MMICKQITSCFIAVIHIQLYTYTSRNIINTIMTNEYASLEKYTSHTLFEMVAKELRKGYVRVMCERWVGGWTETATYWPPVPLSLAALLSRSAGLLKPEGPALCRELILTASNCNKLTSTNWTSCRTGLYHCLTTTCFLWASNLHPIQPVHSQGNTQISSTGCTCSLIDGWVESQYATFSFRIEITYKLSTIK